MNIVLQLYMYTIKKKSEHKLFNESKQITLAILGENKVDQQQFYRQTIGQKLEYFSLIFKKQKNYTFENCRWIRNKFHKHMNIGNQLYMEKIDNKKKTQNFNCPINHIFI